MKNNLNRRDFLKSSAIASSFFILPRHVLGKGFLAPSDMVNMAFIGCGKQSNGLQSRFHETGQVNIVAAADPHRLKLERFTKNLTKLVKKSSLDTSFKAYEDYRQIIEDKSIDSVVVVTPDHWHAAMTVKAAEAGKDIYCEKPLALTVKEGRAMVKAVRKNNRVLQTGSMQRSWPEFLRTAELIRNGYLGEIKEIFVNVGNPPKDIDFVAQPLPNHLNWDLWMGPNTDKTPYNELLAPTLENDFWALWREYKPFGGGYITDWGAHMFDIVQWALDMDNSGPVKVSAPLSKNMSGDIRGLKYTYKNGITVTHKDFGKNNGIRFIGSEGTLDVQRKKLEEPDNLKKVVIKETDIRLKHPENHYIDFINSMRSRELPICDVEIGHRTSSMCNIGNIAYELGAELDWNPKKETFKNNAAANALLGREMRAEHGIII
ncbi:Gfo/Idh/MocA family protein [Arcticibacterium luteifluviistationis]|uniref:Oxidoreductase n=1 Tax=Arcticibacterium luteifluviistationis TaxID=1784714 RepID=A0A2Z4GH59_9BACT|nr:Gfo/Idh/MocA family oxidoreductase [Arcticibacterium luteifluviistationis]AWW00144.1 oxidoreductase [Arcticibacterium luteifluviistationis]